MTLSLKYLRSGKIRRNSNVLFYIFCSHKYDFSGISILNGLENLEMGQKFSGCEIHVNNLLQLFSGSFLFEKWNISNIRTFKRVIIMDSL